MSDDAIIAPPHEPARREELSACLAALRQRTPARVFVGRHGGGLPTGALLALRQDHAAALDAVHAELDLERDLGRGFVADWKIFEIATRARDKAEYLMRPDLGRSLCEAGRKKLVTNCPPAADVQIAIGDGLSALAVAAQTPALMPLLADEVRRRGWSFGRPFFVRRCRVGVLNDLGDLLRPTVLVLMIGERPGLATAESLSAYMAWRPRAGQTDADRNLISNIHARGVSAADAARRIAGLAAQMMAAEASGVAIKEELPATTRLPGSAGDG
jgi:ethanolamine ammonia-lyase small subunit